MFTRLQILWVRVVGMVVRKFLLIRSWLGLNPHLNGVVR